MIRLFCVFFFGWLTISRVFGQYQKVEVGIDGFTCSMCGMSVENSIRMLPFVSQVDMNLNENRAVIYFRPDREVSILKLAEQVYASGFSVRYIEADYRFSDSGLENFQIVKSGQEEIHLLGIGERRGLGLATIVFLNKKLTSKKNYTRWEEWIKKDIKKNGKKDNVLYATLKQE
jgi:cation transport ATPase